MAKYVPVSVAAKRIGVNERTIRKWAASGRIPARPGPSGAMEVEVEVDDTAPAPVNLASPTAPYAESKSREKYYQAWMLETRAAQLAQGWVERPEAERQWAAYRADVVKYAHQLRAPLLEIAPGQDALIDSLIGEALDLLPVELDWSAAEPAPEIVREDAPEWNGEDYGSSLAREKQAQADLAQHRARRQAGEIVHVESLRRQSEDAVVRTRQALLRLPIRLLARSGSNSADWRARVERVRATEQFTAEYSRIMGPLFEEQES